jgi:predicted amidohydrolase
MSWHHLTEVMGMRLALCQYQSATGDVGANQNTILSVISQTRSDVYIFPELFLTGQGADYKALAEDVQNSLDKIELWCMEKDIAVLVGAPSYGPNGIKNSLFFITSKEAVRYDKLFLARFGTRQDKDFTKGEKPMVCSFKGMTFGLSIGYDLFFPEIYRNYALSCADVNICISATVPTTKPYYERILPARSLENLMYTVFVNSVGCQGTVEFCGSSRLVGPLGDTLGEMGSEERALCVYVDKDVIANARKERGHLEDRRIDINWRPDDLDQSHKLYDPCY